MARVLEPPDDASAKADCCWLGVDTFNEEGEGRDRDDVREIPPSTTKWADTGIPVEEALMREVDCDCRDTRVLYASLMAVSSVASIDG